MSATGRTSEAGATLIEMLVVVGILALVTGLVFPAWTSPLQRVSLYRARAALIADLRTARADSVREGGAVTLDLSDDGHGYGWEQSRVALPAAIAVDGEPRSITFFADGTSSGGALKIMDQGRTLALAVDPATGLVAAAPG
jgi:general secretion pathway protein H